MNKFDGLNFSQCLSEEVISILLTLSVELNFHIDKSINRKCSDLILNNLRSYKIATWNSKKVSVLLVGKKFWFERFKESDY